MNDINRRQFLRTASFGLAAAGALSFMPGLASAAVSGANAATGSSAIRPFRVQIPEADLANLRQRIKATRWPDKETVADYSQGVKLVTVQSLASYWAKDYDWRKIEARLNSYPNFITEIDGVDIHFIHVRSKHKNALPVIITHGWPGSVIEQLKVIEPLVNPTAFGGSAADAFDVVIPSLPGHGFSGKPTSVGWGPERIARAWGVLMNRLGYDKYVAQGGDWGAIVTDQLGVQEPRGLVGIHTTMAGTVPADIDKALWAGNPLNVALNAEEKIAVDELKSVYDNVAYARIMTSRPQTLTGLTDSPVGLAAFLMDHDLKSQELIARVFAGQREGLSRDDILDNITLYWLTNTAVSASRLYWENKLAYFTAKGVKLPVAVSVFPDELYQPPRSWAEKAYPKLVHYNRLNVGGHFAAWEQPALFTQELRNGFRSMR
jgi:pimeloyl-ACP methyl ester carboxylesterase